MIMNKTLSAAALAGAFVAGTAVGHVSAKPALPAPPAQAMSAEIRAAITRGGFAPELAYNCRERMAHSARGEYRQTVCSIADDVHSEWASGE
jgi:hypothetical protein